MFRACVNVREVSTLRAIVLSGMHDVRTKILVRRQGGAEMGG